MSDWLSQGCEYCRDAWFRRHEDVLPVVLVIGEGPVFLRRCRRCGAWWEENLREMHVIDGEEARRTFPAAFESRGGGVE